DSTYEVTVANRGGARPLIVKLALPPGAEADDGVRELRFAAASAAETRRIAVRGGVELAPVQRPLTIGDSSDRLRIVSTGFERGRYTAHLQGLRGRVYRVRLLAPFRIQSMSGGEMVTRNGSWIDVAVDFPTGDGDWTKKDLVVSFEVSEPPRLVNDRLAAEFGDRGLVA